MEGGVISMRKLRRLTITITITEGAGTSTGGYILILLFGILFFTGAYYLYQRAKRQAEESTASAFASAIELVFSAFDCDTLAKEQLSRVNDLLGLALGLALGLVRVEIRVRVRARMRVEVR